MNRIKLAKALIVYAVASDFVAHRINKRRCNRNAEIARNLAEENELLHAALQNSLERSSYLIQKLVENDVPCDEYDLIVLNNLI